PPRRRVASARNRRPAAHGPAPRPGAARRGHAVAWRRRFEGGASPGFYTSRHMPLSPYNAGVAPATATTQVADPAALAVRIRALVREAGFQRCGITGVELGSDEEHLRAWLARGFHGSMDWMARHGDKR